MAVVATYSNLDDADSVIPELIAIFEPLQGLLNVMIYAGCNHRCEGRRKTFKASSAAAGSETAMAVEHHEPLMERELSQRAPSQWKHIMFSEGTKTEDGDGVDWRRVKTSEIMRRKEDAFQSRAEVNGGEDPPSEV